jgi:7,8-dihydropterin-6-yl-methyl-4-(beta-D-ribofuranosyl)aminobenzene 5'-phosphate synthase
MKITGIGREMPACPSTRYFTGHCTGRRAFGVLKEVMAERLAPITTGTVLDL